MSSPSSDVPVQSEPVSTGSRFFLAFALFWILGGVAALIMSIVCFGLSGSTLEKIVGLAIAFFLGPLYFLFYGFNKGYCRKLGINVVRTVVQ
jgi:hypothetical protein